MSSPTYWIFSYGFTSELSKSESLRLPTYVLSSLNFPRPIETRLTGMYSRTSPITHRNYQPYTTFSLGIAKTIGPAVVHTRIARTSAGLQVWPELLNFWLKWDDCRADWQIRSDVRDPPRPNWCSSGKELAASRITAWSDTYFSTGAFR